MYQSIETPQLTSGTYRGLTTTTWPTGEVAWGGGGAYISVAGAVEHWFGTRRGKAKSYVIREPSATQDNQLQDKTGTCYAHVISFPHGYRTLGQTGEL